MGTARVKRPTSSDVARLAGVSRATVSFVINAVPSASISTETRKRVWEAVAQLDYHPHEAARNLRSQASRIIAVAIPDALNPHYLQFYAGVEVFVKRHGYSSFLAITNFDTAEEQRCFEWLKQKRNDALILSSGAGASLLEEIRAIRDHGYVVTTVGSSTIHRLEANINSIMPNQATGAQLVVDHLVGLGHRKIGYIYGVANIHMLGDRLETAMSTQRMAGLPVVPEWVRICGPAQQEGFLATQALLAACAPDNLPTALVVVNDLLATAVLAALAAAGIRVPEDMSVVSFDNIPGSAFTIPPLTTVDYDTTLLGEEAARLTIARLQAPEQPAIHIELPPQLVVRASTAAPRL